MGRYITGDFEWKFELGKQPSNFGEIMDDITMSDLNTGDIMDITRIYSDFDEHVIINVKKSEEFQHLIQQYIDEDDTGILSEWDIKMLYSFIDRLKTVDDMSELHLYVDY